MDGFWWLHCQRQAHHRSLNLRGQPERGLLRALNQIPQHTQEHLSQQAVIYGDARQQLRECQADVEPVLVQHLLEEREHPCNHVTNAGVAVGLGQPGHLQPEQLQPAE